MSVAARSRGALRPGFVRSFVIAVVAAIALLSARPGAALTPLFAAIPGAPSPAFDVDDHAGDPAIAKAPSRPAVRGRHAGASGDGNGGPARGLASPVSLAIRGASTIASPQRSARAFRAAKTRSHLHLMVFLN